MALWQWSKTPTANGTADPTMNWVEGMAPSLVNDNVRALMARLAEYRDDVSGVVPTVGTATAYTLTTNQGLQTPTPTNGQVLGINPHVTNGNNPTLAVDGGTAYPILIEIGGGITVPVPAGTLIQFSPYTLMFAAPVPGWLLRDFYVNPSLVPLGALIPFTGSTSPNSNFVLPAGQAISRTTFAAYFALVGTTFGAGDGSTTFNVVDMRGCTFAALDNLGGVAAGRIGTLVTDSGTIVGTTLGSFGGSQSHGQTITEGYNHGHTGSGNVSDPTHTHNISGFTVGGGVGNAIASSNSVTPSGTGATAAAATGITVPSLNINGSGGGAAMAWLQPTRIVGCLLRVA